MNADSETLVKAWLNHLRLERGLSTNTILGYSVDLSHLTTYMSSMGRGIHQAEEEDLLSFLSTLNDMGIQARSQARILASLRSFYRYLIMEKIRDTDPTALIQNPRMGSRLPDVLSVEEIDAMLDMLNPEKEETPRNRAIIEMLYGSGLRVSELTGLRISRINFEEAYVIIDGKGNKQRIVPISDAAMEAISEYMPYRDRMTIKRGNEDILFLNRRGAALTRVMIFYIIKDLANAAGLKSNVSPHTLRHSFATHLVEGGANLRVVQEMLGHELISTTEVYLHIDRSRLRNELLMHHPHYCTREENKKN